MDNSCKIKKMVAVLFVIMLFVMFISIDCFSQLNTLSAYLAQKSIGQENIETQFTNQMLYKTKFFNLHGLVVKALDMKGFYSNSDIFVSEGNYIISSDPQADTDYEFEQITSFYEFLKENGIQLLYVNQPVKYMDDSIMLDEFGVKSYSNRNADLLLKRIEEAGIPYLDLREKIKEDNIDIRDLFYRTDHHWTTKAGFWATRQIARSMNDQLGYDIDLELYDISRYEVKEWKNCWLGEQGKKISKTYIGLDDYTEIKPAFKTNYTFTDSEGRKTDGSFDAFIDESRYSPETDVYQSDSWHYSYLTKKCVNHDVKNGKVLMLADSYSQVTEPFLSLGVNEIDSIVLRDQSSWFRIRQYILDNQYDTVLICYAQFMIGAHNRPDSANYRMFSFGE